METPSEIPCARFSAVSLPSVGQRADARYRVFLEVTLESANNFYHGLAENLSVSGVFIATYMWLPVGERIAITMDLPNSAFVVRGVGEVCWVRECQDDEDIPPGLGIRFVSLEPGATETIEAFLANRDPLFFEPS